MKFRLDFVSFDDKHPQRREKFAAECDFIKEIKGDVKNQP